MYEEIPEHLREEARLVEEEIRAAFKGVSREGGVSWSGSRVVDNYGSEEEIRAAAELDTDRCWEDLVADPAWIGEPGIGGFSFLDAIGYRYYLAPAMIRCMHRRYDLFLCYAITIDRDYVREQASLISPAQAQAIARFVRFMIAMHAAANDRICGPDWTTAYTAHWKQFDTGAPLA